MNIYSSCSVRCAVAIAVVSTAFGPLVAMAAEDFTRYSHEELVQLRSRVQNMGEADRLRYREAMQSSARNRTPEEGSRPGIGQDSAQTERAQTRERAGEDHDRGQGETQRERERAEQRDTGGYGSGYEARQGGARVGGRGR